MKKALIIGFFTVLGLLLTGAASILHEIPTVPPRLEVGTPFTLVVRIVTAPGDSINPPALLASQRVEIQDIRKTSKDSLQWKLHSFNIRLAAFDTGIVTVPPLEFSVDSKGTITHLKTKSFNITVFSSLKGTSDELKENALPIVIEPGAWAWITPTGVLLAIALTTWLLRRKYLAKWSKQPAPIIVPEAPWDTRSIVRIALDMLRELKAKNLPARGDFLEYYYQLSYILRFFLEKRYNFNALEMTTGEIARHPASYEVPGKTGLLEYLTHADGIKFAGTVPTEPQMEEAWLWLNSWLTRIEQAENAVRGDDNV